MVKFLKALFSVPARAAAAANGIRVEPRQPDLLYAVGDVHGRLDLLQQLEARIAADAERIGLAPTVVYLGDLVDRGPQSAAILDRAIGPAPAGWTRIHLAGNHELMMLGFLQNPKANLAWLDFGGAETLFSYGMSVQDVEQVRKHPGKAAGTLAVFIPEEHIRFLERMITGVHYPGLLLVHAGIRPGTPIEEQTDLDLTRIKTEFLASDADHGAVVVHGHSIVKQPERRANRIAIDTGAYATGTLTAVRLQLATEPAFLQVSAGRDG
ncbi:metallophosphoesterase [Pannonibacter tanglangensis]|uniref:Serine/threonine protein phosphatase n=1 Tax=Pannonibacter tanglangensis TaxID=2750084 RepID=A0ABW9ZJV7_9HYPH|nr:metallophosphoesterase [Pannonibacter sp. XCT-34]NBN63015.1 serine/threonine protein phosphatase [Pannonibacter sp. XCT-34]